MIKLPMILGDPQRPQQPKFLHFVFPFVIREHKNFKFDVKVDRSKSQPI